jgi:regulator of protease activity HflC (stomatin/prohibitin superfamily)
LLTLLDGPEPPSKAPEPPSSLSHPTRDPYRGVVLVLLVAALVGAAGALAGGLWLSNPVLLDAAVTLGLAAGILIGVAAAQYARAKPFHSEEVAAPPPVSPEQPALKVKAGLALVPLRIWRWVREPKILGRIRLGTAMVGALAIIQVLIFNASAVAPSPMAAGVAAGLSLVAAGLAATAARYLAGLETARFPEGPGLLQGARIVAWILVLAGLSIGLQWAGLPAILRVLHFILLLVNVAACYGLFIAPQSEDRDVEAFPLDLGVLSTLGRRTNILASILDAGERQLGIDLRSTWALTVVRQGLEPLAIGLCFVAWLSTMLTVVGVEEQGLVERLGVPVSGQPLESGLHLHLPWPFDRVYRIPVKRVQALTVGHQGEEGGGPENVLWAKEHAAKEYTLLLGNGRDLITVDAAVQFRISDAKAWRYHCQNPADALRAIAYRAVMRQTVNRTLSDALSQNVVTLTGQMRGMVQQEADALGLGVEVMAFTVGGMHPPVMVASDYQAVVSAEVGKVTAVVNAQVFRNETVPAAEALVLTGQNTARAEGAEALARASGQAWSFRTLESQFRAAPGEYFFRRRLETLEKGLAGRRFVVIDNRIQRDGGESDTPREAGGLMSWAASKAVGLRV